MGNWNINIQGIGAHHNEDYAKDANRMALEFVAKLKEAGHQLQSATFTHGAAERLDDDQPPRGCPLVRDSRTTLPPKEENKNG
jgi:hypothetical protein